MGLLLNLFSALCPLSLMQLYPQFDNKIYWSSPQPPNHVNWWFHFRGALNTTFWGPERGYFRKWQHFAWTKFIIFRSSPRYKCEPVNFGQNRLEISQAWNICPPSLSHCMSSCWPPTASTSARILSRNQKASCITSCISYFLHPCKLSKLSTLKLTYEQHESSVPIRPSTTIAQAKTK